MEVDKFMELYEYVADVCQNTLLAKNREYARGGDKLANFKKSGAIMQTTPEYALLGMMTKHVTSIYDMVRDLEFSGDPHPRHVWLEKIKDNINYLILLFALLTERNNWPIDDRPAGLSIPSGFKLSKKVPGQFVPLEDLSETTKEVLGMVTGEQQENVEVSD